jgi:hypothetical protein
LILADQIRQYVLHNLITPARVAGHKQVTVRAGDVHQAMGLADRMPAVCGALDAHKFLSYASVQLISRTGPRQGANAEWVFGWN